MPLAGSGERAATTIVVPCTGKPVAVPAGAVGAWMVPTKTPPAGLDSPSPFGAPAGLRRVCDARIARRTRLAEDDPDELSQSPGGDPARLPHPGSLTDITQRHEPAPIAEYALLSDCKSAALVSRGGSVDWLCCASTASIFGRLLDDRAGHWSIAPTANAEVTRRYVDGTMLLETNIRTPTGTVAMVDRLAVGRNERGHQLGAEAPSVLLRRIALTGTVEVECEFAHDELQAHPPAVAHRRGRRHQPRRCRSSRSRRRCPSRSMMRTSSLGRVPSPRPVKPRPSHSATQRVPRRLPSCVTRGIALLLEDTIHTFGEPGPICISDTRGAGTSSSTTVAHALRTDVLPDPGAICAAARDVTSETWEVAELGLPVLVGA